MPVSLRLSEDLERRVAALIDGRDTSAHAFMLEAIREKVEAEEARAAFHAEAEARLAHMKKTGRGVPAEEVFAWLRKRAAGARAPRPRARRLP